MTKQNFTEVSQNGEFNNSLIKRSYYDS